MIDILKTDADDSDQRLRSVVLDHLVNDSDVGFPPSSIENDSLGLISRVDLGAALYRRLERCGGWNDFEERLELDLEFRGLKPPEVLLQADDEEVIYCADGKTGMTVARKLELVELYFSHGQWYRE